MRIEELHELFLKSNGVSTDTRKIIKDVLYFALKGENFNGNQFASEALEKGASFAIIDEAAYAVGPNAILVDDVLKTLQDLASFHRKFLKLPIIALTGSNGKTTTKELINAVLSSKYRTVATKGNLNNHIGVPLTLLSMSNDTEIGIVEMGANHVLEIEALCNIAYPDYGYITNFGKAHLEGFGSVEGVIKGKSELYEHLIDHNKHVFLNADDNIQKEKLSTHIRKFGFTQVDEDYYVVELSSSRPFLQVTAENITINSNLIGKYNFGNIAAAVLIGKYFNVDLQGIKAAIESYVPANNRSQVLTKGSNKVILDAYNANPTSMMAALNNFNDLENKKIVILGDMFELGKDSALEHQLIVDRLESEPMDQVYLVGVNFFNTKSKSERIERFSNYEDFKMAFETSRIEDATILIKGSRGMALERTLDLL